MAYTTELQRVVQYLKAGGKIKPPAGALQAQAAAPTPTPGPFVGVVSDAAKPAKAQAKPGGKVG